MMMKMSRSSNRGKQTLIAILLLLIICCGVSITVSANLTLLHLYDDDDNIGVLEEGSYSSGSSSKSGVMRMLQAGSNSVLNSLGSNAPAYGCGRGANYCLPDKEERKLYCDPRSRTAGCHLP